MAQQPYSLIEIRWLELPAWLKYPSAPSLGLTGYRDVDGPAGLFSVYLAAVGGKAGAGTTQTAKMYALAEEMRERLPSIGMKFWLSTGTTVVAECATIGRGEDEPNR